MLDIKIEEMSESGPPPVKRLKLVRKELEELSKEDLIERWLEQSQYVDHLEARRTEGQKDSLELVSLRESEEKLRQQQLEATRRENLLVMRLAAKEQEMQEYANQIQELKQAQTPGSSQLRATLLDPAVNLMFERMKKELNATKAKLEETQNELSAWKFTPDSNTGKRLMAKCRLLYQENEELGKMISSGRMAKLEGDLALQKNFSEEMKKSQAELDEFLLELDEDVEGMQSTIYYLQQQLKDAKEQITQLHSENERLQTVNTPTLEGEAPSNLIPAATITAVSSTVSVMSSGNQLDTGIVRDDIPTPPPSHLNGQSDEHEGYSGLNHSSQTLGPFTSQPPSPDSLDMNSDMRGCVADISDTNVAAFTCVSPEMRLAVEEEEDEEMGEDCMVQEEQLRTYNKENSSRQRLEPVEETVITSDDCEQSQSPWHPKIEGERSVSNWTSSDKGIKDSGDKLVVNGTSDSTCLISDDDV